MHAPRPSTTAWATTSSSCSTTTAPSRSTRRPAARAVRPRTGVGADGLIRATPADAATGADVAMALRNADGSPAEMSGNGIRCLAQAVVDAGWRAGPERRGRHRRRAPTARSGRRPGDQHRQRRHGPGAGPVPTREPTADVRAQLTSTSATPTWCCSSPTRCPT